MVLLCRKFAIDFFVLRIFSSNAGSLDPALLF